MEDQGKKPIRYAERKLKKNAQEDSILSIYLLQYVFNLLYKYTIHDTSYICICVYNVLLLKI